VVNFPHTRSVLLEVCGKGLAHEVSVGTAGFADQKLLRLDKVLQQLGNRARFRCRLEREFVRRNLIGFIYEARTNFFPTINDVFNGHDVSPIVECRAASNEVSTIRVSGWGNLIPPCLRRWY